MTGWIGRVADWLAEISVVSLLVLTAIVTIGVTMRYVFNNALTWADEVASYSLLAMVFFGLAHTLHADAHIRIDFFLNRFPRPARDLTTLVAYAIGILFAAFLILACWARFENFWVRHTTSFTDLRTPLYLPAIPLLIGSAMFFLMMLAKALQHLAGMVLRARSRAA
ncbi:MAG: TRAP transporter small permease [Candidatus Lambdaproteobacteria bacterium]|nr:TRAP transporter small permease [Candidatus Lambdaproteobacteria bacterium]